MKYIYWGGLGLFALFFILFQGPISERIRDSNCTKLEFFEVKFNACDEEANQFIQNEKDSISSTISFLEDRYLAAVELNDMYKSFIETLEKQLAKNASSQAQKALVKDLQQIKKIDEKAVDLQTTYSSQGSRIEMYKKSIAQFKPAVKLKIDK